jgi:hypothetical protein
MFSRWANSIFRDNHEILMGRNRARNEMNQNPANDGNEGNQENRAQVNKWKKTKELFASWNFNIFVGLFNAGLILMLWREFDRKMSFHWLETSFEAKYFLLVSIFSFFHNLEYTLCLLSRVVCGK